MTTITFDTLKLSRKLESAGFTHEQAVGAAEALADTFTDSVATKRDIQDLSRAMNKIGSDLEGKIRESELRMTIRLGSMQIIAVGAVAALVKLL